MNPLEIMARGIETGHVDCQRGQTVEGERVSTAMRGYLHMAKAAQQALADAGFAPPVMLDDATYERASRAAFYACYQDTHMSAWTYAEQDEHHGTYADEEMRNRFRRIARAAVDAAHSKEGG